MGGFECPSVNLCVASGFSRGSTTPGMWASRHPQTGLRSFRKVSANGFAPGISLGSQGNVSCPSKTFCAAISHDGPVSRSPVFVSTNPARRGSWFSRSGPPPGYQGQLDNSISCPSSQLCVAYTDFANPRDAAVLQNPTNRHSRWRSIDVDPDSTSDNVIGGSCNPKLQSCVIEEVTGAACVAPASCLLTTDYGRIITSTNAAAGPSAWTRTRIYGTTLRPEGYWGLSNPVCFSISLCYILGARGDLLASTNPFSPTSSWSSVAVPHIGGTSGLDGLHCPSEHLCFVTSATSSGRQRDAITTGHIGGL